MLAVRWGTRVGPRAGATGEIAPVDIDEFSDKKNISKIGCYLTEVRKNQIAPIVLNTLQLP